jgi:aspartate kinase
MDIVKIMKFGGTSVGNPDRMRALIPLITDNDKKVVVLSAMAGTTNNLVEITELLYDGNVDGASEKIELLRTKYHGVVHSLYSTGPYRKTGLELIDSHFVYINNFTLRVFTKLQEKAILAQGELISTSLFHNLLKEKKISSVLLPALNFMRIDKDGEPDSFYIKENIARELKKLASENIIITQGFI